MATRAGEDRGAATDYGHGGPELTVNIVILDRDGVINYDSDYYIKSPEEWQAIPGSLEAISRLNHAGYRVVVATNQSGLRRKLYDIETLNHIHQKMQNGLSEVGGAIEAIFICACLPSDECECFKPRPGMLLEIAERLRVSLIDVPVIGDAIRDMEVAESVGARPVLVRTGKLFREGSPEQIPPGVEIHEDLAAVVDVLLGGDPPA